MRQRPRALDLFCGAGGVSMGLHRAGFDVVGVDIEPQPEYPFEFVQGDALAAELDGFDLVHGHVAPRLNLIPAVRAKLIAAGCAWSIENVPGAPLIDPVVLCGSMFGLDVRRHRLFEASFPIPQPPCRHELHTPRFPQATNRANLRRTVEVGVWRIPLEVQRAAMGIDWMSLGRLSQAVPPAYAEHVGRAALAHLDARRAA